MKNLKLLRARSSWTKQPGKQFIFLYPKYEVTAFSDGLSRITNDPERPRQYAYLNDKGEMVIEFQDQISGEFSEGLALGYTEKGYLAYYDKNGEIAVQTSYTRGRNFSEGLAAVERNRKFGFIDANGHTVIQPVYDEAHDFSDGLAVVRSQSLGSNLYGYINKKGVLVIKPQFLFASQFSERLAAVKTDSGFGYIDKSGKMIVALRYQFGKQFSEGLAAVQISQGKEEKWGFIDRQGNIVIAPEYQSVGEFKNGRCRVRTVDGSTGFIDRTGRFTPCAPWEYSEYDMVMVGYQNSQTGEIVITPQFLQAKEFSEGLAAVRSFSYPWKWGYINEEGTMVIAPKYDDAGSFKNGKAWVVLDGRQGSIDKNRRFVPDKAGYSPNYISPSEQLMADLYLAAMKEAYKLGNGGNGFIAVDTDTLYGLGPAGKLKIMNELKSLSPNVYEYSTIKNDKTKFQFKDGIIVRTINGTVLSATINSYTGETATISAASWFGILGAVIPEMEASLENGVWMLRVKRVAMA
ncbi:MAG: WG repeat-containing protein [Clostridiales Family XIII bacterium]|nr:WG repeat-containing protein [Clostridiales Family XIII bacterium]